MEKTLYGTVDKVKLAIAFIQEHATEPLYVGDSGGKDSGVLRRLVEMSGVEADYHHNNTTIHPLELVKFVRNERDVIWENPKRPLLKALITNGAPSFSFPWCCKTYKEQGGKGRLCAMGLRHSESHRRSKRRFVELCRQDPSKRIINPILDWTDDEVWEFHRKYKVPYCELYDQGFARLGCLFCPKKCLADRLKDTVRWPEQVKVFIRYFQKRVDHMRDRKLKGYERWDSGEQFFRAWIDGMN